MLNYTAELYARIGRKYIPTGKTGADWDALVAENARLRAAIVAAMDEARTLEDNTDPLVDDILAPALLPNKADNTSG